MANETQSPGIVRPCIPTEPREMASLIDHTLLRPEATWSQIEALCAEAVEYGFCTVCVNPIHVPLVRATVDRLTPGSNKGRTPIVGSVAGFPLGASRRETKADEAARALDDGATEIDMVAAIGSLADGDAVTVRADILAVAKVVHRIPSGVLKVILEAAAIPTERVILGCRCAAEAEADFVKTSTGLHPSGGATVELVRLLHRHAAPIKVKASGGIRTARECLAMIEAGASRIGTSSGVAILAEFRTAVAASRGYW